MFLKSFCSANEFVQLLNVSPELSTNAASTSAFAAVVVAAVPVEGDALLPLFDAVLSSGERVETPLYS